MNTRRTAFLSGPIELLELLPRSCADPLFVDLVNGDFWLQASSPCRDKALDTLLPTDAAALSLNGNTTEALSKDLDLNPRINGEAVDMGAFEWHP